MGTTRLTTAAGLGLALALLGACGSGGGEPPRDASTGAFCDAILGDSTGGGGQDAWREYAEQLAEIGTPKDIPSEARAGFEQTIEDAEDAASGELDEGDDLDAARAMTDQRLSGVGELMAINQYVLRTCGESLG